VAFGVQYRRVQYKISKRIANKTGKQKYVALVHILHQWIFLNNSFLQIPFFLSISDIWEVVAGIAFFITSLYVFVKLNNSIFFCGDDHSFNAPWCSTVSAVRPSYAKRHPLPSATYNFVPGKYFFSCDRPTGGDRLRALSLWSRDCDKLY
jgi:hypothetical protein